MLAVTTALLSNLAAVTESSANSIVSTAPATICAFETVPDKSPPTEVAPTFVGSVINDNTPEPLVERS